MSKDIDKFYKYNQWFVDRVDDNDPPLYGLNTDTSDENLSKDYLLDRIDQIALAPTKGLRVYTGYSQYDGEE